MSAANAARKTAIEGRGRVPEKKPHGNLHQSRAVDILS